MDNHESTDPQRDLGPKPPPAPGKDDTAAAEGGSSLAGFVPHLIFLSVFIGICVLFYRQGWVTDLHGVGSVIKTALGLGLVIFIHELGHFAVAKWCGVYVKTFSIGFGPPIPGCAYKYGETWYQIGVLPLGGFVNMLGEGEGEGADGEDDDTDPRSFKNKPVGQRMAIISAGVVMNIILGFACFVFVYMTRGAERRPAVLDQIEAGSPAAIHGFRTGAMMTQIDDIKPDPGFPYVWFDRDLLPTVMLSDEGQKIYLVLDEPGQPPRELRVEPRLGKDDKKPMLGILPPGSLELPPIEARRQFDDVFVRGMVAEQADPPFTFGDSIIGLSDPAKVKAGIPSDDPKSVTELPVDPRDPKGKRKDYFEYGRRIQQLAGQPLVIRVERKPAEGETGTPTQVDVKLPAAYRHTFGLRMRMGQVAAIRLDSPAAKAGLEKEDIIEGVEVKTADGKALTWVTARDPKGPADVEQRVLDPERLPAELEKWAATNPPDKTVTLRVVHKNPPPEDPNDKREARTRKKLPMQWDDSWRFNKETPFSKSSPLSIPQLGLAYKIETKVAEVEPNSPAAAAGFQEGDVILQFTTFNKAKADGAPPVADRAVKVSADQWASALPFFERHGGPRQVSFKVQRGGEEIDIHEVTPREDKTWPSDELGIILIFDSRLQKADNIGQAIAMGWERTYSFLLQVYGFLGAMAKSRLSPDQLAGPITIGTTAFQIAGSNMYQFILFLGIISVNLAVVNFLPIPILDGGHMVFLIYEKLRGKPASDAVQAFALRFGLLLIISLMIFVIYLDIDRIR